MENISMFLLLQNEGEYIDKDVNIVLSLLWDAKKFLVNTFLTPFVKGLSAKPYM